MTPPKPISRPDRVSLWRYLKLFRQDILSAQPDRLYGAWMAEFRTPFFRSYLTNDPTLIRTILNDRPRDFPKSDRIGEGLRPLLGQSVFLTNGPKWDHQRRIIDPAFERGRLTQSLPAMWDAGQAMVTRVLDQIGTGTDIEIEEVASHAAADVIFRTLFSIPIEDKIAAQVFHEFRTYQRSQPILNLAAFVPLPRWFPRFHRAETKRAAERIRALITQLVDARRDAIAKGTAPDDLATRIMTTADPETGQCFTAAEMVDQVAIFFLAGHETSASALSWALYCCAAAPEWQTRIAEEAEALSDPKDVKRLKTSRDVFRETLRLYPPVPMMVRETTKPESFRKRAIPKAAQLVLSPWHLHRHTKLWTDPDTFDPARWQSDQTRQSARDAYMPFSAGPRVCPGAGFAMAEGPLLLSMLLRATAITPVTGKTPQPVAHLTVRARDGIWLRAQPRRSPATEDAA
ncbi:MULTISPECIES: cytochrome P450 [Marivita]|uniref:Cytochrome P450 n=1 Tax=Marivita cryptomonadis TaxID=505252 RepID=A0A9Q2S0B5_9RHOB|nr:MULTISPECIES: cytochrome P450 [Marivita]MCR9169698.1 cytochrome P450 [Paracoccaceae bacterium]MBM2320222.1 cytochrome P450 [Marivita cryptomonadis]MBM2329801.1 cytochrome P450 [Marivita cryptomonadis]MBM2339389.1 cytochrome P450 [Marivita cryptomonadis]MBM2344047.1 cytochrome P450 [Marivita cryptomonadis]